MTTPLDKYQPSPFRLQRVETIRRLQAQGQTHGQIAQELGLAVGSVRDYLNDPDGRKGRKRRQRYEGICVDCRAPTCGSEGFGRAPVRCLPCSRKHISKMRKWPEDRIISAIQQFAESHGRPPVATEWVTSNGGRNPPLSRIQECFGSWANAIEAAGCPRPLVGHRLRGSRTAEEIAAGLTLDEAHKRGRGMRMLTREDFQRMLSHEFREVIEKDNLRTRLRDYFDNSGGQIRSQ